MPVEGPIQKRKIYHEVLDRLITCVGLDAPYYPEYASAYPQNLGGRSPLTMAEVDRLKVLTGVQISDKFSARQRAQLSFARPERSRILAGATNDAARAEALALIQEGARRLRDKPRADMDGFAACVRDQAREAVYQARWERELRAYAAIREGRRVYDEEQQTPEEATQ